MSDEKQNSFLENEDIEARLDWVRSIVGKLVKSMGLPVSETDELVSAGYLGYVEAAGRYDPETGKKFEHYAVLRVRGAIIDAIRKNCHLSPKAYKYMKALEAVQNMRETDEPLNAKESARKPLSQVLTMVAEGALAYKMSIDDTERCPEIASETEDAEEKLVQKEKKLHMRDKIKDLDEEERKIVVGYYFEEKSFSAIATDLDVSKGWISKVHKRALHKLSKTVSEEAIT